MTTCLESLRPVLLKRYFQQIVYAVIKALCHVTKQSLFSIGIIII